MLRYTLRRVLQAIPLLLGAATVTFVLIHLAPGDPIVALAGEDGNAEYYAMMRTKFGLDRPIGERLLIYLGNLARGDMGFSYRYNQPALAVVLDHLPATLLLVIPSLFLATASGITLALLAANRAHSRLDFGITIFSLFGQTIPVFWLALLLLLLCSYRLDLFPIQGMINVRNQATGIAYGFDLLHHMALPVAVLTVQFVAPIARIGRAALLEVTQTAYIHAARARGLSQRTIMLRQALPNALLPIVTVIGGQVGFMLSGAVLTETVFAWPGLGRVLLTAMLSRDYAIVTTMFLLTSATVIAANLVTDLLYYVLDPRIAVE